MIKPSRTSVFLAAVALLICGCASQSPAPAGWKADPGATGAWSNGAQHYTVVKKPFAGTLQDLASQQAIDVVLAHKGSRFANSDPIAACPGHAAIATFTSRDGTTEEGFAVARGQAYLITYTRPAGTPADSAALDAMQRTLCGTLG